MPTIHQQARIDGLRADLAARGVDGQYRAQNTGAWQDVRLTVALLDSEFGENRQHVGGRQHQRLRAVVTLVSSHVQEAGSIEVLRAGDALKVPAWSVGRGTEEADVQLTVGAPVRGHEGIAWSGDCVV